MTRTNGRTISFLDSHWSSDNEVLQLKVVAVAWHTNPKRREPNMKAYETSTTVEPQGDIRVVGVPFAAVRRWKTRSVPSARTLPEFAATWQRVTTELRR